MSRLRVALVVLGDAMLIVAALLLLELDRLVHNTLYGYSLTFSYEWAEPYWLLLRLTIALIVIAIIVISLVEIPHPMFEEKTEG
jgi:hypothetical protein